MGSDGSSSSSSGDVFVDGVAVPSHNSDSTLTLCVSLKPTAQCSSGSRVRVSRTVDWVSPTRDICPSSLGYP
jgi:hypothetical protein